MERIKELTGLQEVSSLHPEHNSDLNRLTGALAQAMSSQPDFLVSPLAVLTGLLMLEEGCSANGAEIFKSLFLDDQDLLKDEMRSMLKSLSRGILKTTSHCTNALWLAEKTEIRKSYLKAVSRYFNAQLFTAPGGQKRTVEAINRWLRLGSGLEMNEFDGVMLEAEDRGVLLNTFSYHGAWKARFNRKNTVMRPFHIDEDEYVNVMFMNEEAAMLHVANEQCEGIVREFDDDSTVFVALKPKSGIAGLLESLNNDSLMELFDSAAIRTIELLLPKLEIQKQLDLGDFYAHCGLEELLDNVQFDSIGEGVRVNKVVHRASLVLDESGGDDRQQQEIFRRAVPHLRGPAMEMCFDSPFVFLIYDVSLKAVLLMGVVTDPGSAALKKS